MVGKGFIRIYTREPEGVAYPYNLANSIHFEVSLDGEEYIVLNENYGMLYPEAQIRSDNTICEKGVIDPHIFQLEDATFCIWGIQVEVDGSIDEEAKGYGVLWTSKDMITFENHGLQLISGIVDKEIKKVGAIELEECSVQVEIGIIHNMLDAWMPLKHVRTRVPDMVTLHSLEEIKKVTVTAVYSDGSEDEKYVDWDTTNVVRQNGTAAVINGKISQPQYPFPLARGYADPVIFLWKGKHYFIATNDNTDDIGLFVRESDSVTGLFASDNKEYCILEKDLSRNLVQTFWAPEFHVIGGELYILFAISGSQWSPQAHMMKLKKDGCICEANDWDNPIRVKRSDMENLTEKGITLDMTYFEVKGKSYLVWSERVGIGTKLDTGSMLYIAQTESARPWQIVSEPVLLSRPLYGWENQSGTINNEGPYALLVKDMVYLAYSGGAACGESYTVGYLMIPQVGNLLDAEQWKKTPCPMLSLYTKKGEYGPGHNSFFIDENGKIWTAYHAKEKEGFVTRSTAIRRVHLNKYGVPILSLTEENDIDEQLGMVQIQVLLK